MQIQLHRVLHESPRFRGCSAERFCNQCTFTLFSKRNTVLRTDTTDIYAPKLHFPANGRSKESAIHFTVKPISPWSWCDPAASHTKLWVTLRRRYKIYCHKNIEQVMFGQCHLWTVFAVEEALCIWSGYDCIGSWLHSSMLVHSKSISWCAHFVFSFVSCILYCKCILWTYRRVRRCILGNKSDSLCISEAAKCQKCKSWYWSLYRPRPWWCWCWSWFMIRWDMQSMMFDQTKFLLRVLQERSHRF